MRQISHWLNEQKLRYYAVAVIILTLVFGTIYACVQQSLRLSANQASAQLAEDTATALDQGTLSAGVLHSSVNFALSLAPFVIVYDQSGSPAGSTGSLEGDVPKLPAGVLAWVRAHGEDRITWQPRDDVRVAAVVVQSKNGFVLGGRNLREVEKIEDRVGLIALVGWLASLGVLGAVEVGWRRFRRG